MRIIYFVWFCLVFFKSHSQIDSLKLIFAGDIMQHGQQLSASGPDKNGNYDFSPNYKYVSPIIQSADIAIANLELTLAGAPYQGYPQFSAPDNLAVALKESGFDALVTANNHSLDRRKPGLERTIDILDSLKIPHTGTFKNREERNRNYPLILSKNNFKIALLNYTYGTNGIPIQKPNIVNLLDTAQINKDIIKAKEQNPDIIIAFLHWGYQYRSLPNEEQKKLAKLLLDKKVDLIIGSHPHVLQPLELIRGSLNGDQLIAYSLGNFISNQRKRYRDGGMLLEVNLTKENDVVKINNAGYYLTWVYKQYSPKMEFFIIPASIYEQQGVPEGLTMNENDLFKFNQYLSDSRRLMEKHNKNVDEFTFNLPATNLKASSVIDSLQKVQMMKSGSWVYIQIFASSGHLDPGLIKEEWKERLRIINEKGINKYQLGPYRSEAVETILMDIKKEAAFKDAFIVKSKQ